MISVGKCFSNRSLHNAPLYPGSHSSVVKRYKILFLEEGANKFINLIKFIKRRMRMTKMRKVRCTFVLIFLLQFNLLTSNKII